MEKKKITMNVSVQMSERLDYVAERHMTTVTEQIRKMIGIGSLIDKALEEHGDIVLARKDETGNYIPFHQITDLTI